MPASLSQISVSAGIYMLCISAMSVCVHAHVCVCVKDMENILLEYSNHFCLCTEFLPKQHALTTLHLWTTTTIYH